MKKKVKPTAANVNSNGQGRCDGRREGFLRELDARFQQFRATRESQSDEDTPRAKLHSQPEMSKNAPILEFEAVHMTTWRRFYCIYVEQEAMPKTYQDVEVAKPERLLQAVEELKLLDGRTSLNCPTTHRQHEPSPSNLINTLRDRDIQIGIYLGKIVLINLSDNITDLRPAGAIRKFSNIDIFDQVSNNIVVNTSTKKILCISPRENENMDEE
uniref:4Fe-4S Mo/W bis-MGD-type domain-containing protein n=1 Tax=Glossina pallidipes TaxID=7398 RepID=A0A1B0A2Q2_GLOPL